MGRKQFAFMGALVALMGIGPPGPVAGAVPAAAGQRSAAPRTRAALPPGLVGTWGKTVTYATWHKNHIYYEIAGNWAIAISKRGVTSIFEPPGEPSAYPLTTMRVAVAGASVVFGPTADGFCPGKAAYTWKVTGRTLALNVVKDDCDARRVLLSAGAWTRK